MATTNATGARILMQAARAVQAKRKHLLLASLRLDDERTRVIRELDVQGLLADDAFAVQAFPQFADPTLGHTLAGVADTFTLQVSLETSGANLFVVNRAGQMITPPLDDQILAGVTSTNIIVDPSGFIAPAKEPPTRASRTSRSNRSLL